MLIRDGSWGQKRQFRVAASYLKGGTGGERKKESLGRRKFFGGMKFNLSLDQMKISEQGEFQRILGGDAPLKAGFQN